MGKAEQVMDQVLTDEAATVAFGAQLRQIICSRLGESAIVYLHGDLGAGKTTLVRGMPAAAWVIPALLKAPHTRCWSPIKLTILMSFTSICIG